MCSLVLHSFYLLSPTQQGSILMLSLMPRILASAWLTSCPLQFRLIESVEVL